MKSHSFTNEEAFELIHSFTGRDIMLQSMQTEGLAQHHLCRALGEWSTRDHADHEMASELQ